MNHRLSNQKPFFDIFFYFFVRISYRSTCDRKAHMKQFNFTCDITLDVLQHQRAPDPSSVSLRLMENLSCVLILRLFSCHQASLRLLQSDQVSNLSIPTFCVCAVIRLFFHFNLSFSCYLFTFVYLV